jgi:hypothetical protein
MGNYVIEQLIPITSSNVDESNSSAYAIYLNEKLMYSNVLILDAAVISPMMGYYPAIISYSEELGQIAVESGGTAGWWEFHVKEGRPLFVKLVYTIFEQDSSYEY